jgi:Holliday junction resolvasome RuvABC DNA-binding subunit
VPGSREAQAVAAELMDLKRKAESLAAEVSAEIGGSATGKDRDVIHALRALGRHAGEAASALQQAASLTASP